MTQEKDGDDDDDEDDFGSGPDVHRLLYPAFHPVSYSNGTDQSSSQGKQEYTTEAYHYKDSTDKYAMSKKEIDEAYGRM